MLKKIFCLHGNAAAFIYAVNIHWKWLFHCSGFPCWVQAMGSHWYVDPAGRSVSLKTDGSGENTVPSFLLVYTDGLAGWQDKLSPTSISWWLSTFSVTRLHLLCYGGPALQTDLPIQWPLGQILWRPAREKGANKTWWWTSQFNSIHLSSNASAIYIEGAALISRIMCWLEP